MTGKLVVIKIGTGSLTDGEGRLDTAELKRLTDDIAGIIRKGNKVILVTSGAIASGIAELGVRPNPKDIIFRQACAATGQSILMSHYREYFGVHGLKVAQVLLTENDLSNRISYIHTCNVLDRLLQIGVVPIINENDVTSVNEIIPVMKGHKVNFSDNSILSALIANAVEADLVVILTTVDGLFSSHPEKAGSKLIPVVEKITPEIRDATEGKSRLGRGEKRYPGRGESLSYRNRSGLWAIPGGRRGQPRRSRRRRVREGNSKLYKRRDKPNKGHEHVGNKENPGLHQAERGCHEETHAPERRGSVKKWLT